MVHVRIQHSCKPTTHHACTVSDVFLGVLERSTPTGLISVYEITLADESGFVLRRGGCWIQQCACNQLPQALAGPETGMPYEVDKLFIIWSQHVTLACSIIQTRLESYQKFSWRWNLFARRLIDGFLCQINIGQLCWAADITSFLSGHENFKCMVGINRLRISHWASLHSHNPNKQKLVHHIFVHVLSLCFNFSGRTEVWSLYRV